MVIVITTGFQAVQLNCFRKKSLSKGKKLLMGFHVSNVKEEIDGEYRRLRGLVLRETPGATSTKKHENVYAPIVELNIDRSIKDTTCSCKAGKGFCKHASAICLYVNEENTCSKTDQPMIWNRPPEIQLQKYHKGCKIETLFPSEQGNIRDKKIYSFNDIENVLDDDTHMAQHNELILSIKAEMKCVEEKDKRAELKMQAEGELNKLLRYLFDLQLQTTFKVYHAHQSLVTDGGKLKISTMQCPPEYTIHYSTEVVVDAQKWHDICFKSTNQSECMIWYKERFLRITSSSRAHQVKTRKENPERLANQFKNQKFNGAMTNAMQYGLFTESLARQCFTTVTGLKVHQTGLIVSMNQPYLACSPDGLIFNDEDCELLEIKCPYTCQDKPIVDRVEKKSFVPYLYFDKVGVIQLRESDKYYTQVQMSMYIIGVKLCHFMVFSSTDFVHLKIPRNEGFLSTLVPKIELFYFEYFIRLFPKNSFTNHLH